MGNSQIRLKKQKSDTHKLFKKPVQKTKQPLQKVTQKNQDLVTSNFFNPPTLHPPAHYQFRTNQKKSNMHPSPKWYSALLLISLLWYPYQQLTIRTHVKPSPIFPLQFLQSVVQSLCQRQVMELSLSLWQVLGKQSFITLMLMVFFYFHNCHGSNRRLIYAVGGALGLAQCSRQVGSINKGYSGPADIDAHL